MPQPSPFTPALFDFFRDLRRNNRKEWFEANRARYEEQVLEPFLKPGHTGLGSINAPMQCMLKEICAQCLQRHVDPETGEASAVFSCFNQDQPLDLVDFASLHSRLRQNAVSEKLTAAWIQHCFRDG